MSASPFDTDTLPPSEVRDTALAWHERRRAGAMSAQDWTRYQAWRRADPEHERHCAVLEAIDQTLARMPAAQLASLLTEPLAATPAAAAGCAAAGRAAPAGQRGTGAQPGRRRWLAWGGAALAASVLGVIGARGWQASRSDDALITTARAQRRQVTLPDGSLLDLNGASQARVRYARQARTVELLRGQALFSVRSDPGRPFRVRTSAGEIEVTGTRFDVRLDGEAAEVVVVSGSVQVTSGPWWRRRQALLRTGQGTRLSAELPAAPAVYAADADATTAWQRGRLVFRDTPLDEVVRTLDPHLPQGLSLGDPALATLRVAATLSVDDPQALLDALPRIAPVQVLRRADGRALIVAR